MFTKKTGGDIPPGIQENYKISGEEYENELKSKFPKL
jgi:hypothetical protein